MASSSMQRGASSSWTAKQNKLFEEALVMFDKDTPHRWHKIGLACGKSAEEVKRHYEALESDINSIETDKVPIPNYKAVASNRGYAIEQR